jgi:hypothetical protein
MSLRWQRSAGGCANVSLSEKRVGEENANLVGPDTLGTQPQAL